MAGQTAILSGKADLILRQDGKRPRIVDVKSGQPRESDVAQVLVEMVMIPLALGSPDMRFDGEVIYPTYSVPIPPSKADEFRPKVFAFLKQLGTMDRPEAAPSESSCRFCEVPDSLCAERWKSGEAKPAVTELF